MNTPINTDAFSQTLRSRSVDLVDKKILLSKIAGSEQEQDLSEPVNCNGIGRVRHFRRTSNSTWPENPLPIEPALKIGDLNNKETIRAQVFQLSSCNWRCWYCYVPFSLLSANPLKSEWLSVKEMLDRYFELQDRPLIIDLSGGQPDLVPEWVFWVMREIDERDRINEIFLWSDDNLSNDYFWRYLSDKERQYIADYQNYGKVCCFKGFDPISFEFNTMASRELYSRQFELMRRHVSSGIDVYCYVTLTSPESHNVGELMAKYVDDLQAIDFYLPLRTIPLEILSFSPSIKRMEDCHHQAVKNQYAAIEAWHNELLKRFSSHERNRPINEQPLGNKS